MPTWRRPVLVSERERAERWVDGKSWDDGRWEDCGPCSVLMLVDAATGGVKPLIKNLEEAERLRMAAGYGPTGGTNIQRLAAASVIKYGIKLPRHVTGPAAIWTALKPGFGAAIAGTMGNFPVGHRLRRWQQSYAGPHSVYIARESSTARVAWIDPLAPKGAYTGDWVSREELAQFFRGPIAAAVISPLEEV